MDNSVTKEQVEEALKTIPAKFYTIDGFEKELLERLFPPPFKPKRGQVIAVRNHSTDPWMKRDFIKIDEEESFLCRDGSLNEKLAWKYARALTTTEINGESDD